MKTTITILLASAGMIASAFFSMAQSTLHTQNFDGVATPALPNGWTTTTNFGTGWRTDSSNASAGYSGASGLINCFIRNSDSSGTYSLLSPVFNTVGYTNLSILFASRVSNNFPLSGSAVPALEYTINGGQNWLNIPYLENNANSTWALVNGGFRIDLPPTAENQPALQFRWRVTIVNNSQGTYRLDDFDFQGTNTSGISEMIYGKGLKLFPNPAAGGIVSISFPDLFNGNQVQISDAEGRIIENFTTDKRSFEWSIDNMEQGFYHVKAIDKNGYALVNKLLIQ